MFGLNFFGFNESKIHRALSSVENAYGELHASIKNYVQDGFVNEMSKVWACNEAQVFFRDGVKPQFDEVIKKINENFAIIDKGVNSAATAWAQKTRSQYTSKNISIISTTIDVSMIQENIGGTRGIDKEAALNLVVKLEQFKNSTTAALDKTVAAIRGCGFLGGVQEENLLAALNKNKTIIDTAIEGTISALNKAITDTVTSYGDMAGKVAQAFNGQ